ncbi:8799_t:CDS:10 [Diversispora eburnea]|uniref:Cytosine-specific methyltransferase n=1 Tax=Diversispora eburnea TaxID=1213867 RepID=A0A9N9A5A3_9GLOM|nr:8799_t:CDS:10 [Diversispora eburnea]
MTRLFILPSKNLHKRLGNSLITFCLSAFKILNLNTINYLSPLSTTMNSKFEESDEEGELAFIDDSRSNSHINTRDVALQDGDDSDDDSDDDNYDRDIMKKYDAKLPKEIKDFEIIVKTKKHSLINEIYVDVPARKKVRNAYKSKNIVEEVGNTEEECLLTLLNEEDSLGICDGDYIKFDLNEFIIYDDNEREITDLWPEKETKKIYWDGLITDGNERILCRKGVYCTFSISGYGTEISDVEIMIQSSLDPNVWYNLLKPQQMYQKLWTSFLWKARMVKYVLDFIHENPNYLFCDLKDQFYKWISSQRSNETVFNEWINAVNGNFDFRSVVANNIDLLWHQAHNLGEDYSDTKFFNDEFCPLAWNNGAGGSNKMEKTVVTPSVYKWFVDEFPQCLLLLDSDQDDQEEINDCCERNEQSKEEPCLYIQSDQEYHEYKKIDHSKERPYFEGCISEEEQLYEKVIIDGVTFEIGDAVEIYPDDSSQRDRCYITELHRKGNSGTFRLVWLYTRNQTILCNLKKDKSSKNLREVFFTTHCECDSKTPMTIESIIRKVKVEYDESACSDYFYDEYSLFCRYYYRHVQTDGAFLTFRPEMLNFKSGNLICGCHRPKLSRFVRFINEYEVGDCILIKPRSGDNTNLYTVCYIEQIDSENELVKLRRFYRFCEVSIISSQKIAINELLYSDYVFDFNHYRSVVRGCHVEYVKYGTTLPVNLLHKGSANHFFFSRKYDTENKSIRPIKSDKMAAKFTDYKYKTGHICRLNGLDLFCGGGSLGRGFEDAGIVKCKWAIDKDPFALKTYRHNAQGDDIKIINESVNKVLSDAILDIILAGSPCQGFSYMNKHRGSDKSQSNNSLVASVASFVDFYRPRYFLLENVARITRTSVFMHLLACLLEIGYQIRFNVVSAAQLGCSQIRHRVFLWGAAKDEVLPEMPPTTHHYKKRSGAHRELLEMGNSLRLQGVQDEKHASLPMITIKDLIGDLPEIDTGIYWDPAYPDHRTYNLSLKCKEILRRVPIDPPLSDYYLARKLKLIPDIHSHASYDAKIKKYPSCNYKYCQRIDKDDVFVTICTVMIREAARAQGFLETDILCGKVSDQYRIVGNSVPRNIAFSLGIQLCKAMTDPNHKSNPRNFP